MCGFLFLFIKIIHIKNILFIHERHRERGRDTGRGGCRQLSCREPNVGLDPRTLGSCPEPKADTQPLSDAGAPNAIFSRSKIDAKTSTRNETQKF